MDESKSGLYQCKLSNSEAGPYFIELISDNKELIIVSRFKINALLNKININVQDNFRQTILTFLTIQQVEK